MRGSFLVAALAGCSPGPADDVPDTDEVDETDTDTDTVPTGWQTPMQGLDGALLSITGTAAADVWTVGADGGSGPLWLHYDGTAWERVTVDSDGDLWWLWLAPDDDVVWAVGAAGRVARLDRSTGTVTVDVLDPELTFFGVWGASSDEVWIVGGNIALARDGAALYRWDGDGFASVELPSNAASKLAMYKVWGSAADDVWLVGLGGAVARWDGDAWTDVPSDTTDPLFTVHGASADEVYAVGGGGAAAVTRFDGAAWTDESPRFGPQLNGVFVGPDGPVAAGRAGEIWRRADGTWARDARGIASFDDFHATWVDPDGGTWAVGGRLSSNTAGTLVYGGPQRVPAWTP